MSDRQTDKEQYISLVQNLIDSIDGQIEVTDNQAWIDWAREVRLPHLKAELKKLKESV